MSDKLQLVVKAGNTYLAQTEIRTFLHPLEVASYQPRRQAEACRTFRRCLHCSRQTGRTWGKLKNISDTGLDRSKVFDQFLAAVVPSKIFPLSRQSDFYRVV